MKRIFLIICVALLPELANADSLVFFGPPDISGIQASVIALQNGQYNVAGSIPASGPGAGKCQETVMPSNLISSGGVTGTAGTCSLIVQCGTSATYIVKQFNVGSGC